MVKYVRPLAWALVVLWQIKTISRVNRYLLWRKSRNLFFFCLPFADDKRPRWQLHQTIVCALLTSLYDYETDWIPVKNLSRSIYLNHLRLWVPDPVVRNPAEELFKIDLRNALSKDGLERGSIAFTFYVRVIDAEWLRRTRATALDAYGRGLQLVDDAIDFQEDRANGHKNCFLTPDAADHLKDLAAFIESDFFNKLEQRSKIYRLLRLKLSRQIDRIRIELARTSAGERMDARSAAEVKEEIKRHMLATRSEKYASWFNGVTIFRCIAVLGEFFSFVPFLRYFNDGGRRAEAIEAIYTASHYVDDVVDKDAALPEGYASSVQYVDRIVSVISGEEAPRDPVERLFVYGLGLAKQSGADISLDMREILLSLRFDAVRQNAPNLQVFEKRELQHYFHVLDIIGTIGGCLKLTREWRIRSADLAELGEATRIFYNLRDLEEDVNAGLFNIPQEDMERFLIPLPDRSSPESVRGWIESAAVQSWCAKEAERGLQLLAAYQEKKRQLQLHVFTRAILHWMYERETTRYLRQIAQSI